MPTLKIDNITSTSFEARVTGLSTSYGNKYISWYLDGESYGWDETVSESDTTSDWITFEDLDSDTEYTVEVVISYDDAYDDRLEDTVITAMAEIYEPDMSGVYIQQRSSDDPTTEITVRLRGLDTDYSEDDWMLMWYIYDPSQSGTTLIETIGTEYVNAGEDRSDTVTFSGLEPGKTYYIECRVRYYVDGDQLTEWYDSDSSDADGDFTTENNSSGRPDYFQWNTEKIQGQPFDLTADEWTGLLKNINDVRVYLGLDEVETGTGIARFTYPLQGDVFTATMYNQCIYQFDSMGLLTYSDYRVLSGYSVTAEHLNLLRDTINNIE